MPKAILTDKQIAGARAPLGRRLEVWDLKAPGLCLRVTDRGLKTFMLRYRAADGTQPRLKLGRFPQMTLKHARLEAGRIRSDLEKGIDPAREKRRVKEPSLAPLIFRELHERYVAACEAGEWKPKGKRKRQVTLDYEAGIARRHVLPHFGELPIADITRQTVKGVLRGMIAQGIGAQTNRAQALIRQVYAYAISEDLVQINPATGFPAFADQHPRRRVWSDVELKSLWKTIGSDKPLLAPNGSTNFVGRPLRIAVMLCALLLQRRAEVVGMTLAELNLADAVWVLPAERMKGGRAHSVPLPPAAVKLIKEAIELAARVREPVKFVFPHALEDRAADPMSLSRAMNRLATAAGVSGAGLHDLRRTGSTAMTSERLGVSPFIRSKVLGHSTDTGGGAAVSTLHYDTNEYLAERRKALELWQHRLLEIVGERPGGGSSYCAPTNDNEPQPPSDNISDIIDASPC